LPASTAYLNGDLENLSWLLPAIAGILINVFGERAQSMFRSDLYLRVQP
jgi:hypothetical protein